MAAVVRATAINGQIAAGSERGVAGAMNAGIDRRDKGRDQNDGGSFSS